MNNKIKLKIKPNGQLKILENTLFIMVGPRDGGFGFDGAKKYSTLENTGSICIQCQAGQHSKCLAKNNQAESCECELCMLD